MSKQLNYKLINQVIELIKRAKIHKDYVSPNLVNDIAFKNNLWLTSEEVVYISDNY